MDHPLTDDERTALEALARDVLRSAASTPDWKQSLAWAEAATACLRALAHADRGLREAGALLDRPVADAPFAQAWTATTSRIAARAEALLTRDVERDVDELAERLGRH